MDCTCSKSQGTELLIQQYRREFHRPENINHYSEDGYKEAVRKYIKFRLEGNPKNWRVNVSLGAFKGNGRQRGRGRG